MNGTVAQQNFHLDSEPRQMYSNVVDSHQGSSSPTKPTSATTPTAIHGHGGPPRVATTPQNIPAPVGYYPNASTHVNYNPNPGDRMSPRSLDQDTYSGGSLSSYRPPSAQSAGYRLATSLMESDSEGYLAPRSSAGSNYQFPGTPRPVTREHDSGVDIDRSSSHDNQSHSSDASTKDAIQFHRSGAIGWTSEEKSSPEKPREVTRVPRPDSLAYRSHDYEELPMKKDQYVYADVDENVRSNVSLPPEKAGSQDNLTGGAANGPYRRRQNPLYGAVIREDSKASGKSEGGVAGCSRCLFISIVVLAILAGIALVLALVAMSGVAQFSGEDSTKTVYMVSTPSYAQMQLALDRIEDLESRYNALLQKYEALEAHVDLTKDPQANNTIQLELDRQAESIESVVNMTLSLGNNVDSVQAEVSKLKNATKQEVSLLQIQSTQLESTVNGQNLALAALANTSVHHSDQIATLESISDVAALVQNLSHQSAQLQSLDVTVQQVRSDFMIFKTEIRSTVNNISRTPGPEGPPGAGNLSQCETKRLSAGWVNDQSRFETGLTPSSVAENSMYVIMGVDCSADLAATSNIEVLDNSDDYKQYRCVCQGTTNPADTNNRFCYLNVWRCPRIS